MANENNVRQGPWGDSRPGPGGVVTGGGGPHDGDMDRRLTSLEAKLEATLPTLATKEGIASLGQEMHKMDASLKTWMVGTICTLVFGFAALVFTAGTFLNSNLQGIKADVQRSIDIAQSKTQSQQSQSPPPVVIQLSPEMLPAAYKREPEQKKATSEQPQK